MSQDTPKPEDRATNLARMAERGRYYRENNFKSLADWETRMVGEFGEDIITLLPEIWNSLAANTSDAIHRHSLKEEADDKHKGKLIELFGGVCMVVILPAILNALNILNPFTLILAYVFLIMVPYTYYYLRKDAAEASKNPAKTIDRPPSTRRSFLELPLNHPLRAAVKLGTITVAYFWLCIVAVFMLAALGLWITHGR